MRGIKKIIVLCAVATMFVTTTLCASAAGLRDVFNAKYYADTYADLKATFGYDENALYQHFITYGLKENRQMSPILDVQKYREAYADLDAAFGDNWDKYVEHYLTFGLKEKRTEGILFDPLAYAAAYPDIQAAFGNDVDAIIQHYLTFGIAEGRTAGVTVQTSSEAPAASSGGQSSQPAPAPTPTGGTTSGNGSSTPPQPILGKVTAYGGGVVVENGNTTTVTFDEGQTLVYAEDSNDAGRPAQRWWAGIHIDMPEGVNREEGKTTYRKIAQWWLDDGEKENWEDNGIVQEDGQYWGMVTPTYMSTYKGDDNQLMYRYAFDWDGDGENDQYVTIIVKDDVKFAEHPFVQSSADNTKCELCGKAQSDSGHTDLSEEAE